MHLGSLLIAIVHLWYALPPFSSPTGPGVCVNGQRSSPSGRNKCEVVRELMSYRTFVVHIVLLVSSLASLIHGHNLAFHKLVYFSVGK